MVGVSFAGQSSCCVASGKEVRQVARLGPETRLRPAFLAPAFCGGVMPVFQARAIINGKLTAATVERDVEPTKDEWEEILEDAQRAEVEAALHPDAAPEPAALPPAVIPNKKLNGKQFQGLAFRCSACEAPLTAVFKDGWLEIAPCPSCLGEMEKVVEATRKFLDRKK